MVVVQMDELLVVWIPMWVGLTEVFPRGYRLWDVPGYFEIGVRLIKVGLLAGPFGRLFSGPVVMLVPGPFGFRRRLFSGPVAQAPTPC